MNPYMTFMNPFPNQGNPMQNQQSYPHSSYEAMPPQFRGYPEGYHPFYHPPCASSCMNGFVYPSQYHGCCNHNFFPSYCPPPPPPSSVPYGHYHHHHPTHCCGGYSVPPGPGAQPPCQFYPMFPITGPTQFDYQKDNPNSQQRFDCPNNMWKGENCLKIEGPRTELKGDSDFKNSPYPFVLVPPNYIKDNSGGFRNESRQEGSLSGDEKLKPAEHYPRLLNGWLPVDIDKWKSSEQMGDDSERKMHKDNERPNFPLPFFYMPYQANDMGTTEQKNVIQQCPRGVSVEQMDDHPLSPIHGESSTNKSNDRIIVCQDPRMMETKKVGDVPSEKKGEGKTAQTTEVTSGTTNKRVGVDNEAKKTSGDGKRKMSSPAKSSKLPPVCLRVDPLPKKKKGCSPSKPSSPPDEKDKYGYSFKEDTKSKVSPDGVLAENKPEEQTTSNEQPKRKVKTIKVFDASSQPRDDVLVSNINGRNADEEAHTFTVKDQPNHTQSENNEDKDASKETLPAGKLPDDSKRRELSEDEAAKIIQSAYRGYEERKWEPLKKLKSIKAVRDEFNQLKKQIDALESTEDHTLLDKSRTFIGESIMNLLLKLDAIQGLPPNVRQVRKSLARDLMSLQDQLDALGHKQAEKANPSALLAKSEEEVQTADRACIQDDQEKDCLLIESGNEIKEKDKNNNQEESPLTELLIGEENGIHKEDVPDVVDFPTTQLNDEFPQDVSSNAGNLEAESLPQNVHDAQSFGDNQLGKENYGEVSLNEDKLNCGPDMGPEELQEQAPLQPGEKENSDDNGLPKQTPSDLIEVGDQDIQESIDEAPGDDTSDLNEASVNAELVSEDPVTEPVQVCEDVQDLSLTNNNEKADDPVLESVTEVMENTEQLQDQNESIELDNTFCVPCEEPAIVADKDYDVLADTTTFLQEQKQADGSLEMFGHPSEPVLESEQANLEKETDEGRSRLQDQFDDTPYVPCEEPAIVADEDYKVPADITTLPQEQKQADDTLDMFGHPSELAQESEALNLEKETDEGSFMPISSSQPGIATTDRNLIEENERLKERLQKFIEAGQEQLSAISSLSKKVRDLERKLYRKKKVKMCRSRPAGSRSACYKLSIDDELPYALAN